MRISDTTETFEAKVGDVAHDTATSARQALNGVGELADAIAKDSRDSAGRFAKLIQKNSDSAVKAFRDNVKAQPSLMVGLAAGAGMVLGLLLAARR
jgi:ElaB/YqjD/DUF883 family membrane-anchored ribosome-binding protein